MEVGVCLFLKYLLAFFQLRVSHNVLLYDMWKRVKILKCMQMICCVSHMTFDLSNLLCSIPVPVWKLVCQHRPLASSEFHAPAWTKLGGSEKERKTQWSPSFLTSWSHYLTTLHFTRPIWVNWYLFGNYCSLAKECPWAEHPPYKPLKEGGCSFSVSFGKV